MIEGVRHGYGAVFFDLDGTLLPGSSLFPLARELRRRGLIRLADLARVGADQARYRLARSEPLDAVDRARALTLAAVRGRDREEILSVARRVVMVEILPRLYPRAVELIRVHGRAGRGLYLATSSPEDYASIIAEHLGMSGALGTRAEVRDGRYTGRLVGALNHGRHKADRVSAFAAERGIDVTRSIAFSDSINDLPMLHAVGEPVVVNADRALLGVARRLGAGPGPPVRRAPPTAAPAFGRLNPAAAHPRSGRVNAWIRDGPRPVIPRSRSAATLPPCGGTVVGGAVERSAERSAGPPRTGCAGAGPGRL